MESSYPRAFQQLTFKFLDGVSPAFALAERNDGRLEPLRAFLRRMWSEVGGSPEPAKAERLARSFSDELKDEFRRAEAEWDKIDQDLFSKAGLLAAGGIPVEAGLIAGKLAFTIPAVGIALKGVYDLFAARMERSRFRKNVPLSVFLDLKR
jgi:hypothetical protein